MMGITKRCTEPQGEASLFQAFAVEQVEHSDVVSETMPAYAWNREVESPTGKMGMRPSAMSFARKRSARTPAPESSH